MIKDCLVINCTGKDDTIALKINNKFFLKKLQTNIIKYEALTLIILDFIKQNNIEVDQKFSIIVNSGPGSFSGIRIALAITKGIKLVKKSNIYTYNSFLLNIAPYLKKKQSLISIQKTNNFYYYSESCFEDNYTFTPPQKIDADCLQKENSIIVVPQEIVNDGIFNDISPKKIKIAEFNLKNIEILIENNLLENKLIKPLYWS